MASGPTKPVLGRTQTRSWDAPQRADKGRPRRQKPRVVAQTPCNGVGLPPRPTPIAVKRMRHHARFVGR